MVALALCLFLIWTDLALLLLLLGGNCLVLAHLILLDLLFPSVSLVCVIPRALIHNFSLLSPYLDGRPPTFQYQKLTELLISKPPFRWLVREH